MTGRDDRGTHSSASITCDTIDEVMTGLAGSFSRAILSASLMIHRTTSFEKDNRALEARAEMLPGRETATPPPADADSFARVREGDGCGDSTGGGGRKRRGDVNTAKLGRKALVKGRHSYGE